MSINIFIILAAKASGHAPHKENRKGVLLGPFIVLGAVIFFWEDLQVPGHVQAANVPSLQRHNMINMMLDPGRYRSLLQEHKLFLSPP